MPGLWSLITIFPVWSLPSTDVISPDFRPSWSKFSLSSILRQILTIRGSGLSLYAADDVGEAVDVPRHPEDHRSWFCYCLSIWWFRRWESSVTPPIITPNLFGTSVLICVSRCVRWTSETIKCGDPSTTRLSFACDKVWLMATSWIIRGDRVCRLRTCGLVWFSDCAKKPRLLYWQLDLWPHWNGNRRIKGLHVCLSKYRALKLLLVYPSM